MKRLFSYFIALFIISGIALAQPIAKEVKFPSGEATIAGTLYLPGPGGSWPTLIVVPGSGDEGRKSPMISRISEIIRTPLLQAGYAVFFYDKRGIGESTGKPAVDLEDAATVTTAAFDFLRLQTEVDAHRIGLYAVSNGAWLAPIVAVKQPEIRLVVLISVAAFTPLEQNLFAFENTDYILGKSRALAEKAGSVRRAILTYLATGEGYAAAEAAYAQLASDPELAYLKGQPPPLPATLPERAQLGRPEFAVFRGLTFDPLPWLRALKQPTLVVLGERDPLVDAKRSATVLHEIGQSKPGWDLTVKVYPGAGHGIELRESDRSPIHNPNAPRPAGYPQEMLQWIDAHMKSKPSNSD